MNCSRVERKSKGLMAYLKKYVELDAVLALAKEIRILTKWDSEYVHRSIDPMDVRELPCVDLPPALCSESHRTKRE